MIEWKKIKAIEEKNFYNKSIISNINRTNHLNSQNVEANFKGIRKI